MLTFARHHVAGIAATATGQNASPVRDDMLVESSAFKAIKSRKDDMFVAPTWPKSASPVRGSMFVEPTANATIKPRRGDMNAILDSDAPYAAPTGLGLHLGGVFYKHFAPTGLALATLLLMAISLVTRADILIGTNESVAFTLNTRPVGSDETLTALVAQAESAPFTMDTRLAPAAAPPDMKESRAFTLDTRLSSINGTPSLPIVTESPDFTLDTRFQSETTGLLVSVASPTFTLNTRLLSDNPVLAALVTQTASDLFTLDTRLPAENPIYALLTVRAEYGPFTLDTLSGSFKGPAQTLTGGTTGGKARFSPDGLRLAKTDGNRVLLWNLQSTRSNSVFNGHASTVASVEFSPLGDQLLTGSADGTFRWWDTASRAQLGLTNPPGAGTVYAAYASDGARVLAGRGGNVALYRGSTMELLREFSGSEGLVTAVALAPEGLALAGNSVRSAAVWDTTTGTLLHRLTNHAGLITAVAFLPGGTNAMTASQDGTIRIWNMATGAELLAMSQRSPVGDAVLSFDGRVIASCDTGNPGTAYLWDAQGGGLLRVFTDTSWDASQIKGVALSPDQTALATTHADGSVRLWNTGLPPRPIYPTTPLVIGSNAPVTLRSHGLYYFAVDAAAGRSLVVTLEADPGAGSAGLPAGFTAGKSKSGVGTKSALSSDAEFANLGAAASTGSHTKSLQAPPAGADITAFRMTATKGKLPSEYDYETFTQASVTNLHCELPVVTTTTGQVYVLAFAPYLAAGSINARIHAEYSDFHLSSVTPARGGNAGNVTVRVLGTGISVDTTLRLLSGSGASVLGQMVMLEDSAKAWFTLPLSNMLAGQYRAELGRSGYVSAVVSNAFEIVPGIGPRLEARLVVPSAVRPQRTYPMTIEYANVGDSDMAAPLFIVSSPQRIPLALGDPNSPVAVPALTSVEPVQALGISFDGPAGVLPPGARASVPMYFLVSSGAASLDFALQIMKTEPVPIPWSTLEPALSQLVYDPNTWPAVWANFQAQVGSTWVDYLTMLDRSATRKSLAGARVFDVTKLLRDEMQRASAGGGVLVAGRIYLAGSGEAVTNAQLSMSLVAGNGVAVATSDSSGRFAAAYVSPGLYEFHVNGYVLDPPVRVSVPGPLDVSGVELPVSAGGSFTGIVSATGGSVLQDALLTAVGGDPVWIYDAKSGADGTYQIRGLAPGTYALRCALAPYANMEITNIVVGSGGGVLPVDLQMVTGGGIAGTILDQAGQPVTGASVGIARAGSLIAAAASETNGHFQVTGLSAGDYVLRATADGYLESSNSIAIMPPAITSLVVQILKAARASGVVSNANTGQPLPGITVNATLPDGSIQTTLTDAGGQYSFNALPAGQYVFTLGNALEGLLSKPTVIQSGASAAVVNFSPSVAGTISGRLFAGDGQTPIAAGIVSLFREGEVVASGLSSTAGEYSFALMAPGTYAIRAVSPDASFMPRSSLLVTNGSNLQYIDFIAGTNAIIGTMVQQSDARPIAAATIVAQLLVPGATPQAVSTAQTETNGGFVFSGLPAGNYSLRCFANGYATAESQVQLVNGSVLPPVLLSVRLEARVSGRVMDSEANPISNAVVLLYVQTNNVLQATTITSSNGGFVLGGLPGGCYEIRALSGNGCIATNALTLPDQSTANQTLVLVCGEFSIRGILSEDTGNSLPYGRVEVLDAQERMAAFASANEAGLFEFQHLLPGAYEVRAVSGGHLGCSRSVTLREGEITNELGINLQPVALYVKLADQAKATRMSLFELARSSNASANLGAWPGFLPKPCCDSCANAYSKMNDSYADWKQSYNDLIIAKNKFDCEVSSATMQVGTALAAAWAVSSAIAGAADAIATFLAGDALLEGATAAEIAEFKADQAVLKLAIEALITNLKTIEGTISGLSGSKDTEAAINTMLGELAEANAKYAATWTLMQRGADYESAKAIWKGVGWFLKIAEETTEVAAKEASEFGRLGKEWGAAMDAEARKKDLFSKSMELFENCCATSCKPPVANPTPPTDPGPGTTTPIVRPRDPNDKIGPAGIGPNRVVSAQDEMEYMVRFENTATASAPVQELIVVDYLDASLDWTTARFKEMAYGGRIITPTVGSQSFAIRDTPPADSPALTGIAAAQMVVNASGNVNQQVGRMEWRLSAMDTNTSFFPLDALTGFLPPEDGTGRGQGYVKLGVRPKNTTPIGAAVTNTATIVFDGNDPIATAPVWNLVGDVPSLAATIAYLPGQITAGMPFTYTIGLTNSGTNAVGSVVLTNALPAGLNILTTTATLGNVTVTNGMLIWDVGTLTNGLGATLTVTASPTQAGTFANTLCFSGGSGLAIFTTPGEITVLPAQKPSLFIRLLEGEVQLAWPTNAADYRLVRAPSLSPTNVWENVTNAPVSVESEYRLNLSPPSSPATGFYKLIKP